MKKYILVLVSLIIVIYSVVFFLLLNTDSNKVNGNSAISDVNNNFQNGKSLTNNTINNNSIQYNNGVKNYNTTNNDVNSNKQSLNTSNNLYYNNEKYLESQINIDKNQSISELFLIIDDFGYYSPYTDEYLDLPIDYTVAILPLRPNSDVVYEKALLKKNLSIIIHQPMEAKNNFDSGRASLMTDMSRTQILDILDASLRQFPQAIGMNNHTGSLFTENYNKMRIVIDWSLTNGLLFIDSRTTNNSVVQKVANEYGMPFYENQIFLDVYDEPDFINKQFDRLKNIALRNGRAFAIGHVQTKYLLDILKERIVEFENAGINFVNVSLLQSY